MAVDPEILEHLSEALRARALSGLEDPDDVIDSIPEAVEDELGERDAELEDALRDALEDAIARAVRAEPAPGERTTLDRIREAFEALADEGIIALHAAGHTSSDGWADVAEAREGFPEARGATFYHGQDLERAVGGDGLFLAFGAFGRDDAEHVAIGRTVCDVLRRHGVVVEWDGTAGNRIRIPPFRWRPRLRGRRRGGGGGDERSDLPSSDLPPGDESPLAPLPIDSGTSFRARPW